MARFTISGQVFELEHEGVEEVVTQVLPDPVREHYVVVSGRRFPPKQILACVTGLDRADFTTHQARRILMRLGFVAARTAPAGEEAIADERRDWPYGGRQAAVLEPYMGKWVAMAGPLEVLVAADTPQEVVEWITKHKRRSTGMFRVPRADEDVHGAAPL